MFSRPKKPFLLIYMDIEDNISYIWCETEEEITAIMNEIINEDCVIIDAIEINSCRELPRPLNILMVIFWKKYYLHMIQP